MDTKRIAGLLQPFFTEAPLSRCHSEERSDEESLSPIVIPSKARDLQSGSARELRHSEQSEQSAFLSPEQLNNISIYIDMLLRWNARMNLTAIREPDEIVTRHFGESLFAARHLFPHPELETKAHLIDLGSGAGFPGIPIKIWTPSLRVTLIESSQKKATFLREVVRSLKLANIDVFNGRAEDFRGDLADFVTLRAVERFETVLPILDTLLAKNGKLALLIGSAQIETVKKQLPTYAWSVSAVPQSSHRVLGIGLKA
jgi:16S rRNA (guanine527-N7)-methyltransferase